MARLKFPSRSGGNDKFLIESRIMLMPRGWIYAASVLCACGQPHRFPVTTFSQMKKRLRGIRGE